MTTGGQSEDFENSKSEIKRPAGNGSGGPAPQNGASSFSLARRGNGPRTVQGKERSKRNALKHGIFSKVVVLPGESQAEFDSLLNGLRDDFEPVGTFEGGLVETLAVTQWRQRRLLIAEAAEIQAGMQSIEWDEKERWRVEASRIDQVQHNGGLVREIANPEALERCLELLQELKDAIERNDFDQESDESILTILYGYCNDVHWQGKLFDSYVLWSKGQMVPEQGEFSPKELARNFLAELADERKRLERYKKERITVQSNRMKLESLRRNVPDSPRLDHLLRYGASLERTFDRTLSQLERAQRMRLGQQVPPPINVNVSRS
jgi:hypothetical protein